MKQDVSRLITEHRGKYLLVNSLARRVREIQSGAKPLVQRYTNDPLEIATEEFREGKVAVVTHHVEAEAEKSNPALAADEEEAE